MGKTLQSKVNGYKYSGLDEGRQETGEFNRREREGGCLDLWWIKGGFGCGTFKKISLFLCSFYNKQLNKGKKRQLISLSR